MLQGKKIQKMLLLRFLEDDMKHKVLKLSEQRVMSMILIMMQFRRLQRFRVMLRAR